MSRVRSSRWTHDIHRRHHQDVAVDNAQAADIRRTLMLLPIHIACGGAAIILGAVALIARKGGTAHRRSGLLFVAAIVIMGVSASVLGLRKSLTDANVFAGVMTTYFVATGWAAVRPASPLSKRINLIGFVLIVVLAIGSITSGMQNISAPGLSSGRVPLRTIGVMSFVLAAVMSLAAIGDFRAIRGSLTTARVRLSRHLWRMCFALFIAAGSFLSIRERVVKVLPAPLTSGYVRALPILLLFATMFYWLGRLRVRNTGAAGLQVRGRDGTKA